jgi:hypothetical protein
MDDLLSLMSIDINRPSSYGFLTYKNLLLTLWVTDYLELPAGKLKPLKLNAFRPFFDELLPASSVEGPGHSKVIPAGMKARFLGWLEFRTGLKNVEITDRVGQTLDNLFHELESEMGRVCASDIDPRYIQMFLLDD